MVLEIINRNFGIKELAMNRADRLARAAQLLVLALVLGWLAGWLLMAGGAKGASGSQVALRSGTGTAQLIASVPLPQMADGQMCEWEPASAPAGAAGNLFAAMQEERASAARPAPAADTGSTVDFSKRKPIRDIHDPYSAYSAVAVDTNNNDVVMTDENLFNVLVYDRTANTPPTATMTEPKRTIGGLKTKIEFQCGLYIDPTNGDIFAVNNDTVDTLVIFSRQARGNVPPTRELKTPHQTFGIAVDEQAQELYLSVQRDSAIVVFPKMAEEDTAPVRLIQGDHTMLADPHGMALDAKNNLLYVTNHGSVHQVREPKAKAEGSGSGAGRGINKPNWPISADNAVPGSGRLAGPSISVYSKDATGDAAPLRVIAGPHAQLDWPTGIAVDPDNGEIFVANDGGDSILVFSATASGDASPIRVIKGPKSMVKHPTGVFFDAKNHELWSANFGNHTATVYKTDASGDVAPLRVIRSAPVDRPVPGMGNPHPIAYDSKRQEILVPN